MRLVAGPRLRSSRRQELRACGQGRPGCDAIGVYWRVDTLSYVGRDYSWLHVGKLLVLVCAERPRRRVWSGVGIDIDIPSQVYRRDGCGCGCGWDVGGMCSRGVVEGEHARPISPVDGAGGAAVLIRRGRRTANVVAFGTTPCVRSIGPSCFGR